MDEKALTELLECSVCLDQLDHTSKVLPCQHTFCRRCLEEIVGTKHELRCPECRFLVECQVDELPTNILLIRLLEGLKTQRGGSAAASSSSDKRKHSQPGHSGNGGNGKAPGTSRSSHSRQNNGKSKPCAKALFNYSGKDPGDLHLKKGEIVFLRKQVDDNWFHGELNGQHGFFPANFVQVLTPLPTTVPQCKALYDFDIDEDKEGDCLSLKKDEIVTVIRKVDDNWIEGKRGDKIGIFPISFGELNEPAKILLRLSGHTSTTQDKGPPATPAQPSRSRVKAVSPPPTLPSLAEGDGPSTASTTTQAQGSSTQPKRHSLTNLSNNSSANSSLPQRRSLNISPDDLQAMALAQGDSFPGTSSLLPDIGPALPTALSRDVDTSSLSHHQDQPTASSSFPPAPPPPESSRSAKSSSSLSSSSSGATTAVKQVPPPPPQDEAPFSSTAYVALYNYKPQKGDELELHKGDYYTVSEKCQDGWYKGQCVKTLTNGVFPGNYVQSVKSQSSAFKPVSNKPSGNKSSSSSSKTTTAPGSSTTASAAAAAPSHPSQPAPVPPRPKTSPVRGASSGDLSRPGSVDPARQMGGSDTPLPPIVPRTGKLASPVQPRQHLSGSRSSTSAIPAISSSSSSPSSPVLSASSKTTRYVRASKSISPKVSGSSNSGGCSGGAEVMHDTKSSHKPAVASGNSSSSTSPIWKHSMSASANITPPNMVVGATGKLTPSQGAAGATASTSGHHGSSSGKKEKKEKDKLSLMKKLVSAGKSKKSRSSTETADTSSHSDSSISHSRSGSYPSEMVAGVQQAEGGHNHKKSGSFDSSSPSQPRPSRPKPLVREKYRSVETYPAQSEIELDLKVGDIIYVHKKRDDGWYKGTLQRSGKTGLVPGNFVEKCE